MLAVAHKVVSKAEGRVVDLAAVEPTAEARASWPPSTARTRATSRSILDESAEVLRADRGRIICRTRHGFVCANAGVDASNAGAPGTLVLLPADPDASARALQTRSLGCAVADHRLVRPRRGASARPRWRSAAPASRPPTTGAAATTPTAASWPPP